jgi:hypothetical protein
MLVRPHGHTFVPSTTTAIDAAYMGSAFYSLRTSRQRDAVLFMGAVRFSRRVRYQQWLIAIALQSSLATPPSVLVPC